MTTRRGFHLFICFMPNGSKAAQARARRIVKAGGGKQIRFSRQYKIEIDQIVYAMVGKVFASNGLR